MSFRYQKQTLYAERGGIRVFEGIDPLTGLPVLIYEFQEDAQTTVQSLESSNIPGLLELKKSDNVTHLVVAFSKKYKAISQPLRVGKVSLIIDSARALKDAAKAGVVHGDIRPQRFLSSQDHALLEGFGAPWSPLDNPYRAPESNEASFSDDVYAWAKSILEITAGDLPPKFMEVIERCLQENPADRPSAKVLFDALNERAQSQSQQPQQNTMANSFEDLELNLDESLPDRPTGPAAMYGQVPPIPPAQPLTPQPHPAEPLVTKTAPVVAETAATIQPSQVKQEAETSFVKDLPPGATYKAGETVITKASSQPRFEDAVIDFSEAPSGQSRRRSILLWCTLVGALLLFGLAFFNQLFPQTPLVPTLADGAEVTQQYIVELEIGPNSLPPVEIIVVSSPDGSSRPNNSVLGQYPAGRNQVALNQAGVWQLQGRFGERVSEVVSLQLPEQRKVIITIPPPPEEEEEEEP